MISELNPLGQPVGALLPDWTPPQVPARVPLAGRFCRVEALDPTIHTESLFAANLHDTEGAMWTYLPYGPFDTIESYREWVQEYSSKTDPLFYAIVEQATDCALGVASYCRITPASGFIEVGHLAYSPLLQRTPIATEAMFLLMEHAFALGYRRYEWKCNALNVPSRSAAERLGFTFEGIFRQATVVKSRNRDTAWFSIIDSEWPTIEKAYRIWLSPENFDEMGKQRQRLSALIATYRQ